MLNIYHQVIIIHKPLCRKHRIGTCVFGLFCLFVCLFVCVCVCLKYINVPVQHEQAILRQIEAY